MGVARAHGVDQGVSVECELRVEQGAHGLAVDSKWKCNKGQRGEKKVLHDDGLSQTPSMRAWGMKDASRAQSLHCVKVSREA